MGGGEADIARCRAPGEGSRGRGEVEVDLGNARRPILGTPRRITVLDGSGTVDGWRAERWEPSNWHGAPAMWSAVPLVLWEGWGWGADSWSAVSLSRRRVFSEGGEKLNMSGGLDCGVAAATVKPEAAERTGEEDDEDGGDTDAEARPLDVDKRIAAVVLADDLVV